MLAGSPGPPRAEGGLRPDGQSDMLGQRTLAVVEGPPHSKTLRPGCRKIGVRWQAKRDTALRRKKMEPVLKKCLKLDAFALCQNSSSHDGAKTPYGVTTNCLETAISRS